MAVVDYNGNDISSSLASLDRATSNLNRAISSIYYTFIPADCSNYYYLRNLDKEITDIIREVEKMSTEINELMREYDDLYSSALNRVDNLHVTKVKPLDYNA